MHDATAPQGAQAALRAIRLLKVFTPEQPEMALADISRAAHQNKTTAHRLLAALRSEDLIDKDTATGRYRLGAGLMALGVQALSNSDLRLRARPLLQKLARETGETATLEVPIDDSMLILDEVAGAHVVGAAANVGTRWPLHATSTGKALIAFDEQAVHRLQGKLQPLTRHTITDRAELQLQLGRIRRRGYAESIDELEEGFSGVGTVVRGSLGEVLGSLSVCGPTQRMTRARRVQLGKVLQEAARRLQHTSG